jgi:deazaflavin-dependent oxidoreductase (nitroreductase family)
MSVRLTPRGTRGTGFPKMAPWAAALFRAMNVAMFRIGGRRMRVQGRPLLLLETVGARTGKRRQTTLGWFPDEDPARRSWLIVASAAGSASHPAWYVNLARRPDDVAIEVGGERVAVRPESLHGAERERAWSRVVALAPGYGKYARDTDREIPIVRLVPKSS